MRHFCKLRMMFTLTSTWLWSLHACSTHKQLTSLPYFLATEPIARLSVVGVRSRHHLHNVQKRMSQAFCVWLCCVPRSGLSLYVGTST